MSWRVGTFCEPASHASLASHTNKIKKSMQAMPKNRADHPNHIQKKLYIWKQTRYSIPQTKSDQNSTTRSNICDVRDISIALPPLPSPLFFSLLSVFPLSEISLTRSKSFVQFWSSFGDELFIIVCKCFIFKHSLFPSLRSYRWQIEWELSEAQWCMGKVENGACC